MEDSVDKHRLFCCYCVDFLIDFLKVLLNSVVFHVASNNYYYVLFMSTKSLPFYLELSITTIYNWVIPPVKLSLTYRDVEKIRKR